MVHKACRKRGNESQFHIINSTKSRKMKNVVSFLSFNPANNANLKLVSDGRCEWHVI
jgi:hypothetical protein